MMRGRQSHARFGQRGATMLVTLVLLVLIGLAAMVSYGSSVRNVKIVGNMQMRNEAVAAAQQVIERTISTSFFTREPQAVAADPIPVDIDGDGMPEFMVRLQPAPACVRLRPIRTNELDPNLAQDIGCLGSSGSAAGADFNAAAQADSLCRETMWDVAAVVADAATGARATLHQGISVRISVADAQNACP